PTHGLVPISGCFPLAPSFDHAGPMARDVAGCVAMMRALVAGFELAPLGALGGLPVGIAWVDGADPLVGIAVERAAVLFPHAAALELPFPDADYPLFRREAAEVHADLFRDHRELYGENVAYKVAGALELRDAEVDAATRARD